VCWPFITPLLPLYAFVWCNLVQQLKSLTTHICLKTSFYVFFSYIWAYILVTKVLRPVWVCSLYRWAMCALIYSDRNCISRLRRSVKWWQNKIYRDPWSDIEDYHLLREQRMRKRSSAMLLYVSLILVACCGHDTIIKSLSLPSYLRMVLLISV
jgi:hypothetical protein